MGVMGRPRGSLNILRDLQRGGGMYFRPPIAASDIPEEVIEQCQMVLQVAFLFASFFNNHLFS